MEGKKRGKIAIRAIGIGKHNELGNLHVLRG